MYIDWLRVIDIADSISMVLLGMMFAIVILITLLGIGDKVYKCLQKICG